MNQASLFDPPIARKRDPDTSRDAAVDYDGSGKRSKDCERLYQLILQHPKRTAAEYSCLLMEGGMHWYKAARMPTKRMHDLLARGDVEIAGTKTCQVTGRKAHMYRARQH